MLRLLIGTLIGFALGMVINSDKFRDMANKLIGKLVQDSSKNAIKSDEDNLEYFYKNLYKKSRMQVYSIIIYLIAYSLLIFFIVGLALMFFNLYIPSIRLGSISLPGWVSFLIGNTIAIIYRQIEARLKKNIKVTFADSLK
jgi:uncharacterized membrane protein YhaH (DUF805 family)